MRRHSYNYGCFLVSGAEVVQFSEHKNVHTIHFLFVFKLLFEKREGEFLATTICPLATKNLYLIASWRPYQKVNFRPCCLSPFLNKGVHSPIFHLELVGQLQSPMHWLNMDCRDGDMECEISLNIICGIAESHPKDFLVLKLASSSLTLCSVIGWNLKLISETIPSIF